MEHRFCGCPACWVVHLWRAGRGLFPGTAGVAGVRVYFWARVRWVLGSSGVGAFCVRARLGSCCAGVFLLRSGPCCVARILGAVGRPPIYACGLGIWRRGVFCVRPRGLWPLAYSVCAWVLCGAFSACCCGLFRVRGWGLAAWRVFCARLWVYHVCYEVDNSPLFNFNRIFPPFPGACRNLARKPLFFGYNAYAVGLMFGVRGP